MSDPRSRRSTDPERGWRAAYEDAGGETVSTQHTAVPSNSNLRAAASEMYEALRDAEAGLVFAGADRKVRKGAFVPTPTLALRAVRAAIAKAEGRDVEAERQRRREQTP